MKHKQKKWLKLYIDLKTELGSKAENQFQGKFCRSKDKVFSGKFVGDVKKELLKNAQK